jgi:hypothetical protein
MLLEPSGELGGQALLHLQAARKQLHHARQLGQPGDPLTRQVGDMRHTMERQEMMHAPRVKGDVADHHQLVVALVVGKRRRLKRLRREHLHVGIGHPPRRVTQTVVVEIGAQRGQQIVRGALQGGAIDRRARHRRLGDPCARRGAMTVGLRGSGNRVHGLP